MKIIFMNMSLNSDVVYENKKIIYFIKMKLLLLVLYLYNKIYK